MSRTPRQMPQSLDAERALLGGVLSDPHQLLDLEAYVKAGDFYNPNHGLVWTWALETRRKGGSVEALTLVDHVLATGEHERWGGVGYLSSLPEQCPSTANLEYYARIVVHKARLRRLIELSAKVEQTVMEADYEDLSAEIGTLAREIADTVQPRALVEEVVDVVARTSVDLGRIFAEPRFIATGLAGIDNHQEYGGLSREGVTLILGASGMGKTSLINRLALGMAATGTPVYLHGTETSTERRMTDMLTSWAGTSIRQIDRERYYASRGDRQAQHKLNQLSDALQDAEAAVSALPLVLTGAGLTVDEVCGRTRILHKQGRCGALVVDYLQDLKHVHGQGLRVGERTAQVGYASTRLKDLAAELRIPVIVGAQVSGEKEGPGVDPRPQLWDVQWSSSAHQDAEEVYALFRGDYYTDRGVKLKDPGYPGKLEVIPRKRRVGTLAPILLDFDGPSRWVGEPVLWRVK